MSGWLDQANRTMLYECRQNKQILYLTPISSILGKLPLVPMGDTATVPFCMQDGLHEVDGLTVTQSLTKAMDADSGTSILGPYYGQQPCSIKVCKPCT